MNVRELAITLIGHAIGEMFGPFSLPPDEYLHVPDRKKIDAGSVLDSEECAAGLVTAAGLDGADFIADEYAGLLFVLEAAVAMVERYELVAG